nr:hypothetical protein [uncultured Cupriavidus sp.]
MTEHDNHFRTLVLRAYDTSCAVTGTRVEPVLEPARILGESGALDRSLSNYILLRSDVRRLFQLHLISVDTTFRIGVAMALRWTVYWQYQAKFLQVLPDKVEERPASALLKLHYDIFLEQEDARH